MIAKSWFSRCWQYQIAGCVAIFGVLLGGVSEYVLAQIVPDNTLGIESSVVTPNVNINGISSDQINGGAIRGANLFHSFSQFNIGEGRGAYFINPAGILNILTRVTGANHSEILGRLGVLGNANLFLINPNGIVFGLNASLDLQGSFLATTANAVKLGDADAGLFSATQPTTSYLLAVSPSALWFNAVAAQPIVNRSQAQSLINQPNSDDGSPGLQVQPGRTLALVGGNVLLESGRLTATGGRIELGSVMGVGQVNLTSSGNRLVLGYDEIHDFGKISLSNGAFVDASGEGGGGIQIQGARLEMTQSSNIWADTLGAENGRGVLVRATEVELSERSFLTADVADTGTGTGGDIRIDTGRLLVRDGAQILVITSGSGNGGSLQITASEGVELIGRTADGRTGLFVQSQGSGNAGDLTINTARLLARDAARVSTTTGGKSKGGRLLVTASESIELIGRTPDGQVASGLFAGSQGSGDAGELRIDTRRLLVKGGAQVSATTYDKGKGGSLVVRASESIELIGSAAEGRGFSGLFAQSEVTASGDAGDLTIDTGRLLVKGGAVISSRSTAGGAAGNINITVRDTLEANNGTIRTNSTQSRGGNIAIRAGNIRLFGDSNITTNVNSGAGGGGNIYLKADSILAFDDSDILAFARDGRGGDITLDTPAFFGENYLRASRNTDPSTLVGNNQADINATGAISSGVINIPDVSFIQNSLTELPENQIDTDSILANSCIVRRDRPTRGSFTITGTGGLPQRPGDAQMSSFPTVDIETLPSDGTPTNTNRNRPWQKGDPIVEPQGVYQLPNGKLVLSRECS